MYAQPIMKTERWLTQSLAPRYHEFQKMNVTINMYASKKRFRRPHLIKLCTWSYRLACV